MGVGNAFILFVCVFACGAMHSSSSGRWEIMLLTLIAPAAFGYFNGLCLVFDGFGSPFVAPAITILVEKM